MKNSFFRCLMNGIFVSTVIIFIFTGFSFGEDAFKEFQNSQMDSFKKEIVADNDEEYQKYKENIYKEFEEYKQIVDAEFLQYKNELSKYWEDTKLSSKHSWTEYSTDLKARRTVDFENQFIELDIITDKNIEKKGIEDLFIAHLTDLLLENQKIAFQRDTVSQRIEKRLKKELPEIKILDEIPQKPILTKVLTGESEPSKATVLKVAEELKNNGIITVKKNTKVKDTSVASIIIPLPSETLRKKADELYPDVKKYCKERQLDIPLVMSVIHTESCFNPMACSYVPAYGLMQIVPESAGKDASEVIMGKQVLLSPSYLYDIENNINVGTTYLYILFNRYLKKIENPESRLYCCIAAYNTGAGNVARAFTGNTKLSRAVEKINSMEPQEVFDHLKNNLPHDETKKYLVRVNERMTMYDNCY